jgi:hypothetical protein
MLDAPLLLGRYQLTGLAAKHDLGLQSAVKNFLLTSPFIEHSPFHRTLPRYGYRQNAVGR